jgi:oxygen-dependent protoporphyrinogen oxidase
MSDTEVLIIGGGISGLSTAWWLAQQGITVELWEKAPEPGGKIHTDQDSGYTTEQAASLLVNFRPEIDRLIRDTALSQAKESRGPNMKRYLVNNGQLTELPMQFRRLARSSLWSRQSKLRLLAECLVPRHHGPQSVSHFIQRRLGREILESALEPFVAGTLASDPDLADARAVLPRLIKLEQRYGSISAGLLINRIIKRRRINRSEAFSFNGGMRRLIDALAATPGIRLRTGYALEGIGYENNRWQLQASTPFGSQYRQVRQLVLCTPAHHTAELLSPVDPALGGLLRGIDYAPLSVLHLGFDRSQITHPLDGSGFLTPRSEQLSFNGNLWMSSLFSGRAPKGKALLSSYLGGARHPERYDWSEARAGDAVCADLQRLIGLAGEPEYLRLDRHQRALPLYHGDYLGRLDEISNCLARLPGLHLTANYIGGVSARERIFQGMKTADAIALTMPRGQGAENEREQLSGCREQKTFTDS